MAAIYFTFEGAYMVSLGLFAVGLGIGFFFGVWFAIWVN